MNSPSIRIDADSGTHSNHADDGFDRFIYLLSHDVRNSLRALIEIPQWIESDLREDGHHVSGSLADNLRLLNQNAKRVDRMLIDLLAYSRIGRMQSIYAQNLDGLIDDVLDQISLPAGFSVTRDLQEKTINIGEQDAPTLLSALLTNAVKHHDKDNGKIHIASRREADVCVIEFTDDGPGVTSQYFERIFEAMTTLKPRDEIEGSGMGLAIVRKIARTYGGSANCVENNSTAGLTVAVRIPV